MALTIARELEESLADRQQLVRVADRLLEVAVDAGAEMVTGASVVGHQLAGALAARSEGKLALWADNGAHGTVLVVEGLLVSGAQLARTAQRARHAGASRVVGAALAADEVGLESARAQIRDEVTALKRVALITPIG